ncbi:O-antigen ligase family protein [Clostridium sp. DSM 100503]|uniref:O-antigen ligase family protein n=1 Tax=Clostridium sp. DSM 100503 TaxID=2963282 RepID=UPI00214A0E1F|nr:O-antigen ligase family protein [Clostridium sp. DSM 100503]MCR1951891.1 O-antigen ligase family protein [Clostridium sp. DSM 100503]
MNTIKQQILNKNNIIYSLITLMMLSTISIISPITTEFNVVILLWGALYFVNDFFKEKTFYKSRYSKILIIYMIIFFIGILINYKNNLIGNIKTFSYTGFFLFVVYSYKKDFNKKSIHKELYNINSIIIIISSIVSFASLLTFIFFIQFSYNNIPQGFVYPNSPALWGFYGNPNSGGMVAVISIIVTIFNIYLYKNLKDKSSSLTRKIYYYFNIIVQFLYLILCNSRGAVVSLLAFIIFASFYLSFIFFKENKKMVNIKSIIISLLLTCIISFVYTYTIPTLKKGLAYIPKTIDKLINSENNDVGIIETDSDNEVIELDRNIESGHVSTGRAEIWTYGLNTLKLNPLFGHGPDNIGLAKQKIYPNDKSRYMVTNNMHNGYLQILLSNGILGFLAFALFIILIVKDTLISLLSNKITSDKSLYILLFFITGLLLSIAVNGLFENVILLTQSYITTVLWIYLSYLSRRLDKVK